RFHQQSQTSHPEKHHQTQVGVRAGKQKLGTTFGCGNWVNPTKNVPRWHKLVIEMAEFIWYNQNSRGS
ncbi:MAG: hypothetical protein NC133_04535, partial [Prevotella sp.]|nr:hypothetical protein [Prevotella sp.]